MVEEELGWEIAGWKIAATNTEMQRALRSDSPIYGRVYAPNARPSPVTVENATLCSPIREVEYQACLGADLPPRRKPYVIEEMAEAVTSLHPGIEVAECRFTHDDKFPPLLAILADGADSPPPELSPTRMRSAIPIRCRISHPPGSHADNGDTACNPAMVESHSFVIQAGF